MGQKDSDLLNKRWVEIGSGAVVSGPFKVSEDELSAMIRRVLANHTHVDQVH